MLLKFVKDSLPWLVPSVALVLVATGVLDRGNEGGFLAKSDAPEALAASDVPEVATSGQTAKASLLTSAAAPAPVPAEPEAQAASYTPAEAETADVAVKLPTPVETPKAEPTEDTRQAALEPTYDAAAFFTTAKENLQTENSCVDDLRTLTSQTQVYFPSGGLTADAAGMEMARLIGVVAQTCPGVRIEVQGHSDPSGNPATNQTLSAARAEQVLLRMGASGIDTTKFVARGYGDQRPSSVTGPESRAYYDRRVEFAVIEAAASSNRATTTVGWNTPACVAELQSAVASTKLFYAPRSISVLPNELDVALNLANQAMACPQARLRVIGHHSSDVQSGETISTGMLRAQGADEHVGQPGCGGRAGDHRGTLAPRAGSPISRG